MPAKKHDETSAQDFNFVPKSDWQIFLQMCVTFGKDPSSKAAKQMYKNATGEDAPSKD